MRVLIVKMSALGDIVHALPVLAYLHQAAPVIEVDWVVEEAFRGILEGHSQISRLHVVRTKSWRKAPLEARTRREIGEVRSALRARKYDRVFDIQGNFKSGIVTSMSGCSERIGFCRDKLQESANLLFTNRRIEVPPADRHVTDQYLRLVSTVMGRDFDGMKLETTLPTSAEDDTRADAFLKTLGGRPVVLFHYGTTWQTKFWTDEGWVELGKKVLEAYSGSSVLLSWGNEDERKRAAQMASAIGSHGHVAERYSLRGLVALLKKVDLVVGGDTGPVHLAAAVGTPTVSIYRASDGLRSGPRGERHRIVQAPMPCTACFKTSCSRDIECRASVAADSLLASVQDLLG